MAWSLSRRVRAHLGKLLIPALSLVAIVLSGSLAARGTPTASAAGVDDHLMCGLKVEQRTQTVAIDPDLARAGVSVDDVIAAFKPWNDLFMEYHGLPIFAVATGSAQDADIYVTAKGYDQTWVDTRCNKGTTAKGNNHSIVYLGARDAWRNPDVLPHELGHTLGFADHGSPVEVTAGHVGIKPCGNYLGVMSYCTSRQSWFMDLNLKDFVLDGDLVRDYWS